MTELKPWEAAIAETNRLRRELDITNAGHIALWIEANTVLDEPMNQCASWLAVQIVEAYERARAAPRTDGEVGELVERLRPMAEHLYDPCGIVKYVLTREDRDAVRQAADRITALSAEVERKDALIEKLQGAISWIEPPFIGENTPESELRSRIGFCVADAKRAALGAKP